MILCLGKVLGGSHVEGLVVATSYCETHMEGLGLDTYDWLGPAVEDSPGPGVRRTGVLGPFCMVWGVFWGSFGLELQIWG